MMLANEPPIIREFWSRFAATQTSDPSPRFYESFHFDDSESAALELAQLVLDGTKRATAALVRWYEAEGKPIPQAGDLSVVTDFHGTPICVMESHRISIVPYGEVTEEFAATEGEGDGSLREWREIHDRYFGRQCPDLGIELSDSTLIVCEEFRVIYREPFLAG